MSDQKHESWEIEADEDGDFFHIGPANEYGALVLSIARTSDERAAQLIAAAPDLLEALKDITARYHGMVMDHGTWDADSDENVHKALSIIAKAEGKHNEIPC